MQKQALVVDDSRVARLTLNKLLSAQQFNVTEIASAEEALDYLQSADTLPDIIFLDVMMDGMDGLTATKYLKASDKLADIPIVICTGNNSDSSDEAALAAGAQSVLTKPPQQQALDLTLSSLVQKSGDHEIKEKEIGPSQLDKILPVIEQKLWPKFRQQSLQISQETVEKQLTQQLEMQLEALKLTIMNQLSSQLTVQPQQDIRSAADEIVNQVLAEQLPIKLQHAISELNLSHQVAEALATSTQAWLSEQERNLQQNLAEKLNNQVEQITVNYLDESIAAMIAPVVKLQVEQQLALTGRNDEIDRLAGRVSQLNKTIMGLAAIILILAVIIFI